MTAREAYRHALSELNQVSVATLLLEDFNYFINKAIYQYGNKKYNLYDKNQQLTDDLRVLTKKAILIPTISQDYNDTDSEQPPISSIYSSIFVANLPDDYWHILNCVCDYELGETVKCLKKGSRVQYRARKLTADIWSEIIDNYYFKPRFDRPYYYLNGFGITNTNNEEETQKKPLINNGKVNLRALNEAQDFDFIGNPNTVQIEIRYGSDSDKYKLKRIFVDYIKVPQPIKLTTKQLDIVEDTSQVLEFPDYVCIEILNELGKLLLENSRDPRLSTNIPVNVSIAPPLAQQQTK